MGVRVGRLAVRRVPVPVAVAATIARLALLLLLLLLLLELPQLRPPLHARTLLRVPQRLLLVQESLALRQKCLALAQAGRGADRPCWLERRDRPPGLHTGAPAAPAAARHDQRVAWGAVAVVAVVVAAHAYVVRLRLRS